MESQYSSISFTTLIVDDITCAAPLLTKVNRSINKSIYIRIVTTDSLNEVYEKLTLPLINKHYVQHDLDEQVIYNSEFYLSNYSTTCRKFVPQVPLFPARPYHKPKHFYIALDDMIWISLCATISVTTFGILIYQYVKKQQKKQMELLSEMILQPRVYKTAKECPKVARLPWEIKSDRVHIDREFLLGEGTISNVYLGWTNKNDLVCSLLELTHMNLLKYLGQISETVTASGGGMTSCIIPYQTLFKIIWEICDGIVGLMLMNYLYLVWNYFIRNNLRWSFGVLLYEVFTLGEVPYEDLQKPEEIIESVRKSRIPAHPKFASKQTYRMRFLAIVLAIVFSSSAIGKMVAGDANYYYQVLRMHSPGKAHTIASRTPKLDRNCFFSPVQCMLSSNNALNSF
uniref:TyrKc domain-containing protein n=1 Tax=Heterorhabditis bacteriophora TaxID=37862 RepID=A0A1I7XRT9_HETBA